MSSVAQASVAARSVSTASSTPATAPSTDASAYVARSQVFADHSQDSSLFPSEEDESELAFSGIDS